MRASRRGVLHGLAAGALSGALVKPVGAASIATPDPTHILWYRAPAKAWTEALPIGNGRMGAMVFGGIARERLQLNEDSLWAGGPYDPINPAARTALPEVRRLIAAGRLKEAQALADKTLIGTPRTQMPYQPLGDLILTWPGLNEGDARDYQRQLDLDTATATTHFTANGVTHRRTVIASPVDQVLMIRIEADRPFDLDVALSSPQQDVRVDASGGRLTITGRNADHAGVKAALRFAAQLKLVTAGGTVTLGEGLAVRGARQVTLFPPWRPTIAVSATSAAIRWRPCPPPSTEPPRRAPQNLRPTRSRNIAVSTIVSRSTSAPVRRPSAPPMNVSARTGRSTIRRSRRSISTMAAIC